MDHPMGILYWLVLSYIVLHCLVLCFQVGYALESSCVVLHWPVLCYSESYYVRPHHIVISCFLALYCRMLQQFKTDHPVISYYTASHYVTMYCTAFLYLTSIIYHKQIYTSFHQIWCKMRYDSLYYVVIWSNDMRSNKIRNDEIKPNIHKHGGDHMRQCEMRQAKNWYCYNTLILICNDTDMLWSDLRFEGGYQFFTQDQPFLPKKLFPKLHGKDFR